MGSCSAVVAELLSIADTCIGDTFCDTFFGIAIGIADTFSKKYRKSIGDTFFDFFCDTDTFSDFKKKRTSLRFPTQTSNSFDVLFHEMVVWSLGQQLTGGARLSSWPEARDWRSSFVRKRAVVSIEARKYSHTSLSYREINNTDCVAWSWGEGWGENLKINSMCCRG